jgi:hypothetical protein
MSLLGGCDEDQENPPSPDNNQPSITKPALKILLKSRCSYEELNDEYTLQVIHVTTERMNATSNAVPNVVFFFSPYQDAEGKFMLSGIQAPASIVLPEYVDMKIADIPLYIDSADSAMVRIFEEEFCYTATLTAEGAHNKDDAVYMDLQQIGK